MGLALFWLWLLSLSFPLLAPPVVLADFFEVAGDPDPDTGLVDLRARLSDSCTDGSNSLADVSPFTDMSEATGCDFRDKPRDCERSSHDCPSALECKDERQEGTQELDFLGLSLLEHSDLCEPEHHR